MGRRVRRLLASGGGALVISAAAISSVVLPAAPAHAATGANFIATGHDMDYHCSGGDPNECAYLKIVVDKVRNGSTLPILALDQGRTSSTPVGASWPWRAPKTETSTTTSSPSA